jgi:uncharacterized membrane-anchored protein
MAVRQRTPEVVTGRVRVDRRTKDLVKRLQPGDVAVIDHEDLDRIAVEGLVEAAPAAVVNASASVSGRYPNVGPLLLVAAGIPLVDGTGGELLTRLNDGDVVSVVGGHVLHGEERIGTGRRQTLESLESVIAASRRSLGAELERFAENTLEYLRQEHHLVTEQPEVPDVPVEFSGRHALIVVRGVGYRDDLAALRRGGYLNEMRPVLIGVDGGADALRELGLRPDVIIGDFDSVSEATLRCGATLVVHAYPGGKAPGAPRLEALGLDYVRFESAGTSEDIAMLLAHEKGAELIVAVGTHNSMVEFLDKGRSGMASTFLVRLRVGPILVDAKGVNQLYRQRVRKRDLALLVMSALFTLVVVTVVSEPLRLFFRSVWLLLR